MDSTTDGYPYPLPQDAADLAGQLQALALKGDADFCDGGQLADYASALAYPGYAYSNTGNIVVAINTLTTLTMATRQFNNLHQGAVVPGPTTFDLPADPGGITLSGYLVGCAVDMNTLSATSGTVRQLFMNVNTNNPFTGVTTSTQFQSKSFNVGGPDNMLTIQQMILAYSGSVSWQVFHANTGGSITIIDGAAHCWVHKIWPANGPVRTS